MIEKLRLDVPLLLPEVTDTADGCVSRLISLIESRSCIDGATIPVTFTAYAKPRYEAKQMVETAEDVVRKISAQISKTLDRKKFTLGTDYEAVAHIRWQGSIHRRNGGESNAWQAVVRFSARVIA